MASCWVSSVRVGAALPISVAVVAAEISAAKHCALGPPSPLRAWSNVGARTAANIYGWANHRLEDRFSLPGTAHTRLFNMRILNPKRKWT